MNITDTIDPKVDQLTADHLIGRTLTIRITDVRLAAGDQPCDIHYEGDAGLPYRPGKSMRRVLVHVWGGDAKQYIGRSMTLYRDDDVQFGGLKVGGLRISHMSDIKDAVTMALTAKKGSKKAFKVQPLKVEAAKSSAPPEKRLTVSEWMAALEDDLRNAATLNDVDTRLSRPDVLTMLGKGSEAAIAKLREMSEGARGRFLINASDDDFPGDAPSAEAAA